MQLTMQNRQPKICMSPASTAPPAKYDPPRQNGAQTPAKKKLQAPVAAFFAFENQFDYIFFLNLFILNKVLFLFPSDAES